MQQYWFTNGNKCITLMQEANTGETVWGESAGDLYRNSLLSAQIFCKTKTKNLLTFFFCFFSFFLFLKPTHSGTIEAVDTLPKFFLSGGVIRCSAVRRLDAKAHHSC